MKNFKFTNISKLLTSTNVLGVGFLSRKPLFRRIWRQTQKKTQQTKEFLPNTFTNFTRFSYFPFRFSYFPWIPTILGDFLQIFHKRFDWKTAENSILSLLFTDAPKRFPIPIGLFSWTLLIWLEIEPQSTLKEADCRRQFLAPTDWKSSKLAN